MPENPPPPNGEFWQLDPGFFGRVFRTSGVVLAIAGLLIWPRFGTPALLGWLLGGVLCLASLWSVEYSVKRYINPDSRSAGGLVGLSLFKFLIAGLILAAAFVAARQGMLSLLWVLPGFTLPYVVVGLKLLGWKLVGPRKG